MTAGAVLRGVTEASGNHSAFSIEKNLSPEWSDLLLKS